MRGLTERQAAAVEAREEAGVEGYVFQKPLGTYLHTSHDGTRPVRLYALEVLRQKAKWPERHQRERRWLSLSEALAVVEPPLGALLMRLPEVVGVAR